MTEPSFPVQPPATEPARLGAAAEAFLREDILDALRRLARDEDERGDPLEDLPTDAELLDAIWGRLPVSRRRVVSRAVFEPAALRFMAEIADSGGW